MSGVGDPPASVDLESLGVSCVSLVYSQCLTPVLHFTALLAVVPLNTEVNPPTEVGLAELAACLKKDLDVTTRADGLLLAPQLLLFNLLVSSRRSQRPLTQPPLYRFHRGYRPLSTASQSLTKVNTHTHTHTHTLRVLCQTLFPLLTLLGCSWAQKRNKL